MKKVMFAIVAVLMFAACNNSSEGTVAAVDSTKVDSVTVDTTSTTEAK
jgi:uncharacterized protein YcfL